MPQRQKFAFWEKGAESSKTLFLHFKTTFHSFALKIETICIKRVITPISKTKNANDVSYTLDLFIHG